MDSVNISACLSAKHVTLGASLSLVRGHYLISMTHYDVLFLLFKLLNLILYLKTLNWHFCYFLSNIVILFFFSTYFLIISHYAQIFQMWHYQICNTLFISHFLVKRMVWHYCIEVRLYWTLLTLYFKKCIQNWTSSCRPHWTLWLEWAGRCSEELSCFVPRKWDRKPPYKK